MTVSETSVVPIGIATLWGTEMYEEMDHYKLLNAILGKWSFLLSCCICTKGLDKNPVGSFICFVLHCTFWMTWQLSKGFLMCFFLFFPAMHDWVAALLRICISFSFFPLESHLLFFSIALRKYFPFCNKDRGGFCVFWQCSFINLSISHNAPCLILCVSCCLCKI